MVGVVGGVVGDVCDIQVASSFQFLHSFISPTCSLSSWSKLPLYDYTCMYAS